MLWMLILLMTGCTLRVASEILAYQGYADWAWSGLPLSALMELTAVFLFAVNLMVTFLRSANYRHYAVKHDHRVVGAPQAEMSDLEALGRPKMLGVMRHDHTQDQQSPRFSKEDLTVYAQVCFATRQAVRKRRGQRDRSGHP